MGRQAGRAQSFIPQTDQFQYLYFTGQALRYLVVVLRGSAGREALEALRPEPRALERAYTGGRISQVVVTAAGMTPALICKEHTRAFGPICKLVLEHSGCAVVEPGTAPAHKGMQICFTHNVLCSL